MDTRVLCVGALLGLLSVVIGASAEHVVRPAVDAEGFRQFMTAVRYHQIGALVITAIGLVLCVLDHGPFARRLALSAWVFLAGTLLFSFSIYLAILADAMVITLVTPVGGTLLIIAWGVLAWAAFNGRKAKTSRRVR